MGIQKCFLLMLLILVIIQSTYAYYDSYPLIFVHGMGGELDAFVEMENEISIYSQKGTIEPEQTISNICPEGIWTEDKISVRITYYYDYPISNWEDMDINHYAQNLSKIIEIVKYCSGKNKVNIISHSMGGLVSRSYIKEYGGTASVNKLIIIGTPNFEGSVYKWGPFGLSACLGINPAVPHDVTCEDILGWSSFYSTINGGDETPGLVNYYTFAGNIDGKGDGLVKYEKVELNGAENRVLLDCDHTNLRKPTLCPCTTINIKQILQNENPDFLTADINCDGCMADNEFPSAVSRWKSQTGITDEEFPQTISRWVNQMGCS